MRVITLNLTELVMLLGIKAWFWAQDSQAAVTLDPQPCVLLHISLALSEPAACKKIVTPSCRLQLFTHRSFRLSVINSPGPEVD